MACRCSVSRKKDTCSCRAKMIVALLCSVSLGLSAGTVARMAPHQGAPAIMVDGAAVPPMTITLVSHGLQGKARATYMKNLGEAGLKVYYVACDTRWLRPGNPAKGEPDGVTAAVRGIREVLDAVPDAWVMLRLNMSPIGDRDGRYDSIDDDYGVRVEEEQPFGLRAKVVDGRRPVSREKEWKTVTERKS